MSKSLMPLEIWIKIWLYMNLVLIGTKSARPRFDTSTDMGNVLVPADAEIDSVIYRLRATDQDVDFPLVFEITATVTPVVRIENLPCTLYNKVCQANVILTRRLTAGRLHDFAVRVRDSKGDSNSMQATISVTNATTPRDKIFPHIPALIMVPEDAKPGKELDYILVRSNPWIGKPVYIELWQPKELFTIRQRQDSSNTRGVITLIGELDFETQSMYTLTIYATDPYTERQRDTRNIAGLHLIVIVQDVQDVPPIFTLAPPLTKINNTVQPGDVILRVHAEDGDKGVPREITYGLVSEGNPFTPFFNVTESTGEIILARPLEELTQITHVGAPIVLSVVAEEIRRSTDEPPAQATVVEVGLLLGEPGNSPPYFENDNYVAWMDENAEPGSAIVFNDPYFTRVRDGDIGKAGVFALKLENNNGTFEININDNPPEFQEESYEITLSENETAGTRVIQVHATDKDTGSFGRIQYTRIIGPGNEAFVINPDTGVITVAMGTSILDREITPQLMLTVEACDEDGKGLRGTVPLIVNLLDVNDNAPVFEKDSYEFILNSDLTNFTSSAIIKAFDADAEPPNNVVNYEIIHGNYDKKFYLDENTGELFLREQITKVRNARHNSDQKISTNYRKNLIKSQNNFINSTLSPGNISEKNETINQKILRKKREDKNIVFTLTARAYDLGVPHLSSTTQINIIQLPLAGVTTIMLLVPGENPDREKTIKTLETITGGKITIKDIRPYTLENLPKDYGNNLPTPDGKKSIVVAQVEQKSPGGSFVDIEKILAALTANGFGIIGGDMTPGNGTSNPKDNEGGKNGSITTIHNEEVIVYRAENKLLFWLLIILGLILLAAIITLIVCCICPGCLLYMAPRKRRIHSSETLIARADNRPRRHLHRQHHHPQLESVWVEKKQAWSADPTRPNWQFNRRNTNNFGIASLPGDVVRLDRDRDHPLKASSLQLHDPPVPVYLIDANRTGDERIFVEDIAIEARAKGHHELNEAALRHEFERDSDLARQAVPHYMPQIPRESHFYRNGNAEVMRLVSREDANHVTVERRVPEIVIDQSTLHRVDGKDILLRRFIEDQKLREHEYHDMQELERQSMESHKRQKEASMQQKQEILLIPERLNMSEDHRHIEEVGPDVQRLIIDHGPDIKENQEVLSNILIHGSTSKISDQEHSKQNLQHLQHSIHDLELARQNALLTRLLLEKDRGVGGLLVDSGSYLETQSLPGQVAAGTQTNQTTATQTEQLNRSRSDNESEDDSRLRRKRSKKRYDEPKRIRTLWMRSPIREEDQYPEKHGTFLRKKIKDIKDGRKSSIEQEVLREISDSLDETGDKETLLSRRLFGSSSRDDEVMVRRDDSSSMEVLKDEFTRVRECDKREDDKKKRESGKKESKRDKKTEPSFRILEREMSSLSKKLSKLAGKTLKCKDSNQESDKFLTNDSQDKEADTSTEFKSDERGREKMDKIEIIKSRSRSTQRVTKSTSLKIPKDTEKAEKSKSKYRKNQVLSTGSSEIEEIVDKPKKKQTVAKKSDEDKFKFLVGKTIKSRLKRQANVEDDKKASPYRATVEKQKKTLVKQLKKVEGKSKKGTSDSSHGKEVGKSTEGSDSKESDRDCNKLRGSLMKQSSSSAVSKESRKDAKEKASMIEPKMKSKEKSSHILPSGRESDFRGRGTKSTDSESLKSDKSFRKQSAGSSKKSSVITSPELGRFEELEEEHGKNHGKGVEEVKDVVMEHVDGLKKEIVEIKETIQTEMMEKMMDKSEKVEKGEHVLVKSSVESPAKLITKEYDALEKEEKDRSKESVFLMSEKMMDKSEKVEKVEEHVLVKSSVESPAKLVTKEDNTAEKDEDQSKDSVLSMEKVIENTKERLEHKGTTTIIKHVDSIKETVQKVADKMNVDVIEKVKDFVDSNKGSPEHDSQTKEVLIDRSGSSKGGSPKKVEESSISIEELEKNDEDKTKDEDKPLNVDVLEETDGKQLVESDKQEQNSEVEVVKDEQEKKLDESEELKELGNLELTKVDQSKREDELALGKVEEKPDAELQINNSKAGEEIKTEDSSGIALTAPKIIMIAPTIEFEVPKEDFIKPDDSMESKIVINDVDKDNEASNLVKVPEISDQTASSDKLLQESKEKLEAMAQKDSKSEDSSVDDQKTDTSSKSKTSLLQVEESLSPVGQSSRRSSQVVISRETSFLNSPKRLSIDDGKVDDKQDPSQEAVPEPEISKPEIPVADKQPEFPSHDNTLLASEQPQSIEGATEQLESSLPFEDNDKHEHSDSTLDALDEDSDVSSESSTKTAFIARPYGTPRHRRLVRMDQVDGDGNQLSEKKIESAELDNEEILEVSLEQNQMIGRTVGEDKQKEDEELVEKVEKVTEKLVEAKEEVTNELKASKGNFDGKEEIVEEVKDSKDYKGVSSTLEASGSKSVKRPEVKPDDLKPQEEPEKLESIKDRGEETSKRLLVKGEMKSDGLKVLNTTLEDAKPNQVMKRKPVAKNLDDKGKTQVSKQKAKTVVKIIPLSKGSSVKLPQKEKLIRVKDKGELVKPSVEKMSVDKKIRIKESKRMSKSEEFKSPVESKEKLVVNRVKRQKRVEHDKTVQPEILDDKKSNKVFNESKVKEKSEDKEVEKKNRDKIEKVLEKESLKEQQNLTKEEIAGLEKSGDVKMKPLVEVFVQKDEENAKKSKEIEMKNKDTLKEESIVEKNGKNDGIKEEKVVMKEVDKEVQVKVIDEPVRGMIKEASKIDQVAKDEGVMTTIEEKKEEILTESSEKSELSSEGMKEESKLPSHDQKQRDRSLSPSKVSKYAKEDYTEAQSRYMEWYKQNREEAERRKLEKKEGEEEDQPPKWLRKSTRQRWLKMSPEDRKFFEVRTPEVTPLTRRRIKPLVNIESEQLKAIVRQGRKLRRAEGEKNLDPPIEIFVPEKPPVLQQQQQQQQPKYHYLLQHSEYQYQRMPPPFYLHPPPVPHPTPQISPQRFEACPEAFSANLEPHLHEPVSGVGSSLQTGTRLRHQQLLEKKKLKPHSKT
ncbi:Similar to Cad86C: Cadherin-86C (Drosophila melanogaster) [Cotesia congregata]|uniref:Similar to Cad86C: Cadherin-86C (Drosophila melanogaster) n=1 Tax=Cotesia congregata TaxID=51543 RepID=A0A8J2HTK9_COTCN|nr:Similar to Cad86C: Cadherin-86C (Drosophila melanogaster) [Cotesia congregata]